MTFEPGNAFDDNVSPWRAVDQLEIEYQRRYGRKPKPSLPVLDLAALAKTRAQPVQFAIERFAPLGEVTLFTGPGSSGKSLLAQQLCTASAAGRQCLGLDVIAAPSLYITCEDAEDHLHYRQERLCEALGVDMAALADKLHLVSLRGKLDNELEGKDDDGNYAPSDAFRRIEETVLSIGAKIVALDNVAHLFAGNENDRHDVTRFVNLLNRLAKSTGAAILLIGHPNKSGDNYSGSTAWLNAVRSQVWLDREQDEDGGVHDPDKRVMSVGKANYTRQGEQISFRWHNWAFVLDDDLPADTRAEIDQAIRIAGANAAFLACLDLRNAQERPVSDSPASRTFAAKEFALMPEAKGFKRADLEAAMDRLFRLGEIEIGVVCRTGRKDRTGLRRKCADLCADPALTGCADPALTPRRPAPAHTPYTTYRGGAPFKGSAPPIEDDDLDWGTEEPEE